MFKHLYCRKLDNLPTNNNSLDMFTVLVQWFEYNRLMWVQIQKNILEQFNNQIFLVLAQNTNIAEYIFFTFILSHNFVGKKKKKYYFLIYSFSWWHVYMSKILNISEGNVRRDEGIISENIYPCYISSR